MLEAPPEHVDTLVDHLAGRLTPEAEREFLAHLDGCEGCAAELQALPPVVTALRERAASTPPADDGPTPALDQRLAAALVASPPAPSQPPAAKVVPIETRRRRRITAALASAAAIVVLVIGAAVLGGGSSSLSGEQVALAGKVGHASATATLAPRTFGTELQVSAHGLVGGRVYALWMANAANDKTPAGTFQADADGSFSGRGRCALPRSQAVRVWITDPSGTTVAVALLA